MTSFCLKLPWFSCEESKAPMDLAMCKTALGELYLVGSTVTPRNLTKAGETALGADQKSVPWNLQKWINCHVPCLNDDIKW